MPAIWLIDAYRAGERGQVRALADAVATALDWPCRRISLAYRSHVVLPHVLGQTTLRGLTREAAAGLVPPWPDLVITCGVRNEPVCRWIRAQSGGRTRYLHLGRPWAALESFDLVVTTPQYRVPDRDNVVNNALTLHSVTPERLAAERDRWAPAFAHLPRPYTVLNVGGHSGPYTLGPRAALRLAHEASDLARCNGGSLLVSTSSRTPAAVAEILEGRIDVPCHLYRWRAGDSENPYFGMLALADSLVVSADSIAMLSEACATGKPVFMFDLGGMQEAVKTPRDFRWTGVLYDFLMRFLWQRLSRDITLVHRELLTSGRAAWLGQPAAAPAHAPTSDMDRAVAAVKRLFPEADDTLEG
jgi:mitochondrial fission protein ELM1